MSQLALQLIAEAKRTNAKVLDLGNCGLTELPDELFELTWLVELNLCNRYWDFNNRVWIEGKNEGNPNKLKNLNTKINTLKFLEILRINGDNKYERYEIKDISCLKKLTKLQYLELSYNQISDISCLEKFTRLHTLDISTNQIIDISPLKKLTTLHTLDISNNHSSDISHLKNLIRLHTLDLRINQISDISFLENLVKLRNLYLNSNRISDVSFLEKSTKLERLFLRDNQIKNISSLKNLILLQTLNLDINEVSNTEPLEKLTKLKRLDLSYNQIVDISSIEKLINLEELYLRSNKISNITPLKKNTNLQTLDLRSNRVVEVSALGKLTKLEFLYLYNNPFEEFLIYEEHENSVMLIKEYFARQAEQNKVKVQLPVKIVMLGNHASGKSTFTNFFVSNTLQSEDSTHILRVVNYPLGETEQLPEAVFFDFGGQDYYHGLYRIYLGKQALGKQAIYLVFWREKHNHNQIVEQDSNGLSIYNFNLNYWLAQKAYFERDSQKPDMAFLIKTHIDESHKDKVPNTVYDYHSDFACCLAAVNEADIHNNYVKDTLKKEIETLRQQNSSEEPQWYIDFLTFLYTHQATNPFEPLTFEYILDNHYERTKETKKDRIDFLKVNLGQLHNSGIILFYDIQQLQLSKTSIPKTQYGLVWTNPSALVEKLHQEVFNRNKLLKGKSPGITTLEELGLNPKTDAAILQLLKIQKVIFYHTKESKYIIPNFLKLSSKFDGHYHKLKELLPHQFTLQFKHFIPFGLINELMCYSGENSEDFCRNGIVFKEQGITVSIELAMEKLQIKVAYKLDDQTQKYAFDRHLLLMLLSFYDHLLPEFPFYQPRNQNAFEKEQLVNFHQMIILGGKNFVPADLFISTDQKCFVKFQDLYIEGNEILAYNEAGNSLNKNISKTAFNSFIENPVANTKKIFISYAHEDLSYREKLEKQLKPLLRKKQIKEVWTDHKILAGQDWNAEIEKNLKEADIVFLLISDDFFASDYIDAKELPIVKERYDKKVCAIIPILVRPSSHWSDSDWTFLQAIPSEKGNLTAISKWADKDDAWKEVTEAIKEIL